MCLACGPDPNSPQIKKISDVSPKDILHRFEGDVFFAVIDPPWHGTQHSVIIDIVDESMIRFVSEYVRRFPGVKSKDYKVYGGLDY